MQAGSRVVTNKISRSTNTTMHLVVFGKSALVTILFSSMHIVKNRATNDNFIPKLPATSAFHSGSVRPTIMYR